MSSLMEPWKILWGMSFDFWHLPLKFIRSTAGCFISSGTILSSVPLSSIQLLSYVTKSTQLSGIRPTLPLVGEYVLIQLLKPSWVIATISFVSDI
jgi:hypothetical protein